MSKNQLTIKSHKGDYQVSFVENAFDEIAELPIDTTHIIIDKNIISLYRDKLEKILQHPSVLIIEATENNKSLDKFTGYVESLMGNRVRRDHRLVAIGGGIIQDITAFLATTLLRGIDWCFYPTTLLAQADSCIGSKSSINVGKIKNILGTFHPPKKITICSEFLQTLEHKDVCSGVGEMLKVHAIKGFEEFSKIKQDYKNIFDNESLMQDYILQSLLIKKTYIEADEFDCGIRNIFNYGHSFGHAIESTTNFAIPHGIAVTIGMDLANYVAAEKRLIKKEDFLSMHEVLVKNYQFFRDTQITLEPLLQALAKDKKNIGGSLKIIVPVGKTMKIEKITQENDDWLKNCCANFFREYYAS